MSERSSATVLTHGNITELIVDGDTIVAQSLYELFDDQRMPAAKFVRILQLWRDEVVRDSPPV